MALKMYIFVNSDLRMSTGKIASQVSHCTHLMVDTFVRNGYEQFPPSEKYMNYTKWMKNPITIVLSATEKQLLELLDIDGGLAFYDTGPTTEVKPNSLTCWGCIQSEEIMNKIVTHYRLL